LNDLWRYDTTDGEWTWISGADTVEQAGTYGTKGTPGSANVPGARDGSISWTDSNGNLWLFGGCGYDGFGKEGNLNDLWRYDKATGEWTWMSGADIRDQVGVHGTMGEPDPANVPCSRTNSISWTDSAGNLWLFGGWGRGCDDLGIKSFLSDLWRYDTSGMWTWMSGPGTTNQLAVYGTKGVSDILNVPGSREGSIAWTDSSGNLLMFGGWGSDGVEINGLLNDLWLYEISTSDCCEGYEFVNGACEIIDNPPVFLSPPRWAGGPWPVVTTDPEYPHKPGSENLLLWAFDDDFLSCTGGSIEHRWMYRPVELQSGEPVAVGEWIVKVPVSYMYWIWIDNPCIADITGPGLFEFKMTVTDCLGQETDSEIFFGTRYYFQVD